MDKRLVILFAALVALAAVGLVGVVPIFGGLVQFAVLLLGLGALALGGRSRYQRRRADRERDAGIGSEPMS
jgi:hypothetical protein